MYFTAGLKSNEQVEQLQPKFDEVRKNKEHILRQMVYEIKQGDNGKVNTLQEQATYLQKEEDKLKKQALLSAIAKEDMSEKEIDTALKKERDYVFIRFVIENMPIGLIGLLISVILSAAMSSASAELSALGTASFNDIYKRLISPNKTPSYELTVSAALIVFWGLFAILFAQFASKLENLIQAVNTLGSLVYGVILGIFMVAFFLKKIKGKSAFWAAIITEVVILYIHFYGSVPYLWYNVIGCLLTIALAAWFLIFLPKTA